MCNDHKTAAAGAASPHPQRVLLPATVVPEHYRLTVTPDVPAGAFEGQLAITLQATESVTKIVCNGVDLVVSSASLTPENGGDVSAEVSYDATDGLIIFELAQPFSGRGTLHIAYAGKVGDNLCGYYRAKYSGGAKMLGTTQFEAVDARRALPCWDEPAVKATFQLTLVVDAAEVALSNTEEVSREDAAGGKKKAVTFAVTPKMSTYLLAWTHGELYAIESRIPKTHAKGESTTLRIFATSAAGAERGRFALEVAERCLPLYEGFFESDYILSKCDLLAIPDFGAGAMENWGHVTYRETSLLCDENSTTSERAYVAIVVAHELAHQWFGNLVTMDWWRELWLNEAFATWVEYWAVDTLYPDMHIWTRFQGSDAVRALELDAMTSSHPIEVEINRAEEVDAIFDAISYCKGCCVLRMVIDFIGIDAFRRGVAAYLKHFAFRNATTNDLWRFTGDAAGIALAPMLKNWTGEMGYPLVRASLRDGRLHLQQSRFLASGAEDSSKDGGTVWHIPLTVEYGLADGSRKREKLTFAEREASFAAPGGGAAAVRWVHVNKDGAAFCRVAHDTSANLGDALAAFSTLDSMATASDLVALLVAGLLSPAEALDWVQRFSTATEPSVVKSLIDLDVTLRKLLPEGDAAVEERFNARIGAMYAGFVSAHGLAPPAGGARDASALISEVRGLVLRRLVLANHIAARSLAAALWDAREADPIPADLRGAVYATAAASRGAAAQEALQAMHHAAANDAGEQVRCLRAMRSATREPELRTAVAFAMSPAVRSSDAMSVLAALTLSRAGAAVFAELVTKRWGELWGKLPPMILGRILQSIDEIKDRATVDALEAFVNGLEAAQRNAIGRNVTQGVEGARTTIAWIEARQAAFVEALREQGQTA